MKQLQRTLGALAATVATLVGGAAHAQQSIDEEVLRALQSKTTTAHVEEQSTEERKTFTLGYNALENGYNLDSDQVRTRLITNIEATLGDLTLGWSGMNQTEGLDPDAYFGRNVLTLGKGEQKLAAVYKMDAQGIIDAKVGLRDTALVSTFADYGTIDATVDQEGGNLTLFAGKGLGKGFSAELYHDMELPFHGRPSAWTELQLNKELSQRFAAYARVEMGDFEKPTYIVGIVLK